MTRRRAARLAAVLAVVSVLCCGGARGWAAAKRSRAAPRNVRAGTIVAIDAPVAMVTLKTSGGGPVSYHCTERTRYWRAMRAAALADFKAGDQVVVRHRLNAPAPAPLYDLADSTSWAWLDRIRHEITPVSIAALASGALRATEGAAAVPIEYRVTEKTAWSRGGRAVDAGAFRAGDRVFVAPRLLPSGAVMAIAVADTEAAAAALRDEAKPAFAATLVAVDLAKHMLRVRTAAGATRELPLAEDCVARRGGVEVALDTVRPGTPITVWRRRDEHGDRVVSHITVKSARSGTRRPRRTPGREGNAKRPAG